MNALGLSNVGLPYYGGISNIYTQTSHQEVLSLQIHSDTQSVHSLDSLDLSPLSKGVMTPITSETQITSGRTIALPIGTGKSGYRIISLSFDKVASTVCKYRLALLNLRESTSEYERDVNKKALEACVTLLHVFINHYQDLQPVSRQLIGVFLKELRFDSDMKPAGGALNVTAGNSSASSIDA
ncbi:hypothetical protein NMY22_g12278 [Coprinellus aureogranulatus]|nr:hypothetical protein NMY22_g12278 [Coprinellus aureogranulatus]